MSRILRPFALLFPLGAPLLCMRPAGAQEPKLSAGNAPASTIAASTFALAQRDAARAKRPSNFKPSAITIPDVNAPIAVAPVVPVAPVATPATPKATTAATLPTPRNTTSTPKAAPVVTTAPPMMSEAPSVPGTVITSVKTLPATSRSVQKAVQHASLTASVPQIEAPKISTTSMETPGISKAPLTGTLSIQLPGDTSAVPADNSAPGTNGLATDPLTNPALNPAAAPKPLASREAVAQRLLLARMDADLARAQQRLDRAQTRLTEGQRQLGSVTNILRAAMMEMGDDSKGLHPFVRVAQRYLGTPYVWGGESARGFDCSGFIMRVMRDLGYRALPHSAAEQFHYGMPVAKELLKPGDIVFFANTYKPGVSHVGIYLGRGRFIHAANSKVGTIVSSLNEPKWIEHYAGARRLIPANS